MQSLKQVPFSPTGYKKLQTDLDSLNLERKNILIRLQAAREMGDLSENGAYKAARFELSTTDREIRRLTYLLRLGYIEKSEHSHVISFGSKVTLTVNGQEFTYTLGNQYESNPSQQKLSSDSPLGKSLMGKVKGDTVSVAAPVGTITYKILDVS